MTTATVEALAATPAPADKPAAAPHLADWLLMPGPQSAYEAEPLRVFITEYGRAVVDLRSKLDHRTVSAAANEEFRPGFDAEVRQQITTNPDFARYRGLMAEEAELRRKLAALDARLKATAAQRSADELNAAPRDVAGKLLEADKQTAALTAERAETADRLRVLAPVLAGARKDVERPLAELSRAVWQRWRQELPKRRQRAAEALAAAMSPHLCEVALVERLTAVTGDPTGLQGAAVAILDSMVFAPEPEPEAEAKAEAKAKPEATK